MLPFTTLHFTLQRETMMEAPALFAALNHPVPTSDWTVSKHQPLEMVLMAKADLETVKTFYEFCPEALTEELFKNVLKCGAKPGVVGFLATKCPWLVNEDNFEIAVAQGPGPGRPTETEIITMANINPEIFVPKSPPFYLPHCLRMVLNWKYSLQLTQSLFKIIAGKTPELSLPMDTIDGIDSVALWVALDENLTTKRTAMDIEAVRGMEPVLNNNNIKAVTNWCVNWEVDAFVEFVRKILSNQSVEKLSLDFPEPSQDEHGQSTWFNLGAFPQLLPQCKIQEVHLSPCSNNPMAFDFLEHCLGGMPCLKRIEIELQTDVDAASPIISNFLCNNFLLETLTIRATSDTSAKGLDPILNSLKSNHTLGGFYYKQSNLQPDKFKRYHEILASILQKSNTTLHAVEFFDGCTKENWGGNSCSALHPSQDMLPFYATLNYVGRKKAREPESTKSGFVDLLVGVQENTIYLDNVEDEENHPATDADVFNMLYGLLHENPGTWSHPGNNSQDSTTYACGMKKRKHSAMS
ncbi:expressed unknown protein [Seminavis robusta]|uniref:Uncharacterized protein n=1 Tax=Seminavis robusta TaxID=568900 RepID=A0A9N8DI61_9STRA|nr:expressed unknown protein [Seminavis robusta]|eukprot:Sro140_g065401.1  (523) ;mRNA; r:34568-36136